MRVLALITDAFGVVGGIGKFNRDLLTCMCEVPTTREVVAIPRRKGPFADPLPKNLRFVTAAAGGKGRWVAHVMREVARAPTFDLVVCGHINLLPVAAPVSRIVRAPLRLIIHGSEAWNPTPNPAANFLTRATDEVLSVSEVTWQRFRTWERTAALKWHLLPNSIDREQFRPGPKDPALLDRYGLRNRTVLMTLGRLEALEKAKGFDEVIELLPRLLMRQSDLAYLVVGDGTDRARLERKARSLGVADRVVFAGHIPDSDKAAHYRIADAFVLASHGEGFGIATLEALACGIPAVASRIDGGREALLEGKLGTLVDPRDPDDLERGIFEALSRGRGTVPEGIDHYSFSAFRSRVAHWLDAARV
jgi:phosphatidylinositol alpha-1,6-mannosyltransferase